jgi:hypothetical protein
MRWIDALLVLLLFLAVCAVRRACGAERPPQAPHPPQAPPCVEHHEPPAPDPEKSWRYDGWQRDSTGAWFRWVTRAQRPAYLAPVLYSQPAAYFAPASYRQTPFRGGGIRRGGC